MVERIIRPTGTVFTAPDSWQPNRGWHLMLGGSITIDKGYLVSLRLISKGENSYD